MRRVVIYTKKLSDWTGLGLKASKYSVKPVNMATATVIGGMQYLMEEFRKADVGCLIMGDYDLDIRNGEIGVTWTAHGKKVMRIRCKKNPGYFEDVVKVFKKAYLKYFTNLKNKKKT